VIASSAGFPDGKPRKTVTFPLFATAGTEDFNLLEMRRLDRELTSPHHLVVFEGGHVWLSSELATRAVEWLELQAMKRGVQPRDDKKIDRIYGKWSAGIDESRVDKSSYIAVQGLASTFDGLKDVSALQARAAALGREKAVRDALKRDRDDDAREERWYEDMRTLETRLQADDDRPRVLMELRRRWKELADGTKSPEDTPDRRLARRVLASLSSGVTTTDAEYLKIISEYRVGRGGRR
jgi:hypothetical protein